MFSRRFSKHKWFERTERQFLLQLKYVMRVWRQVTSIFVCGKIPVQNFVTESLFREVAVCWQACLLKMKLYLDIAPSVFIVDFEQVFAYRIPN